MKMTKLTNYFAVIMTIVLTACGSNHQEYQINVDDVQFGNRYYDNSDFEIYTYDNELTQIFEVVPGTYTITADYISEGLTSGSNVNLRLKLKLLRPVEIKDENMQIYVNLLDANDKIVKNETSVMGVLRPGGGTWKSNGQYLINDNKAEEDAYIDFIDFLSSPAGTEREITFGMFFGMKSAYILKNVTGIEIYLGGYLNSKSGKLNKNYIKWADECD